MVSAKIKYNEIRPGLDTVPVQNIEYVPLAYRAIYTNIILARETHRISPETSRHGSYAMSLVAMYHMFIDQMMCDTLSRVFDLRFPDYGNGDYPEPERINAAQVHGLSLSSGESRLKGSKKGPKVDEYANAMGIQVTGTWRDRFLAFCDMRDFLYHNICVRQRSGSLPAVVSRYCEALGIDEVQEGVEWPEVVFSIDAMERLVSFIENEIIPRLALQDMDSRSKHCRFKEFESGNTVAGASAHLRDRCLEGILNESLIERYKLGCFSHYKAFYDRRSWILFPNDEVADGDSHASGNWLMKRTIRKIIRGMDRRLDAGHDTTVNFPGEFTSLLMSDGRGYRCRAISITQNGNILCTGDGTPRQVPRHKVDMIYLNAKASITRDFFKRLASYNVQKDIDVEITGPDGVKRPGVMRFKRPEDESDKTDFRQP